MVLYCVGCKSECLEGELMLVSNFGYDGLCSTRFISHAMAFEDYGDASALEIFLTHYYDCDFFILGFDPNLYDDERPVSAMLNEICFI